MPSILVVALKDLRLLSRDRFALFWVLAFPLMYALFFGSIFGGGDEDEEKARIPIAVVDEARDEASARLVERLAAHGSLAVEREEEGGAPHLATLDEARSAVRRGARTAYVCIRPGAQLSPFALFRGSGGAGGPGAGPLLEIGIDPSRSAEAGLLQGVLMEVVFGGLGESFLDRETMNAEIARVREAVAGAQDLSASQKATFDAFFGSLDAFVDELGADPGDGPAALGGGLDLGGLVELVDVTRERGNRPRSAFEITFPSAMIWGLMSVAMAFAITLTRERARGTLLRLRVAPLSRGRLLAGKALGCWLACLAVMGFLVLFGQLALGVRVGSVPLLLVAMTCTAACFTGLMMLAATLGKSEEAVAGAMWGVMMPFAMIGGGMIPLVAMPPWLARLSDFSPFKWGIYSVEGAIWRGFGPQEMLLPCAILVGIGAAFFALGVWIFGRIGD